MAPAEWTKPIHGGVEGFLAAPGGSAEALELVEEALDLMALSSSGIRAPGAIILPPALIFMVMTLLLSGTAEMPFWIPATGFWSVFVTWRGWWLGRAEALRRDRSMQRGGGHPND